MAVTLKAYIKSIPHILIFSSLNEFYLHTATSSFILLEIGSISLMVNVY